MAWARLDDQFWSNPKIIAAGNQAAGIFARALCYCSANDTDGFVPAPIGRQIGGKGASIERLISARLWTKAEPGDVFLITGRKDSGRRKLPDVEVTIEAHGYYIRDYLHYNRARTDARAGEIADERADVQIRRANESAESAHKDARATRPVPSPITKEPAPAPHRLANQGDTPHGQGGAGDVETVGDEALRILASIKARAS